MIWTVMMISLRRLIHNPVELALCVAVPIAFFSIFALIFGGAASSGASPNIKVVAVDTLRTDHSRAVMEKLRQTPGLYFVNAPLAEEPRDSTASRSLSDRSAAATQGELTRHQATEMVRRGTAATAILIRQHRGGGLKAELLSDASDQIAPQIVAALVQRALLTSAPQVRSGPQVTAAPHHAADIGEAAIARASAVIPVTAGLPAASGAMLMPTVEIVDVLGGSKSNPVVTMYAAGIAVMFLLFGATSAGGALLEEREKQTLDRLLTTGLSMDELLLGKWTYQTLLGAVQTTLMFLWGQAVFGVDLLGHLDGFLIITLVTAGAAAAFGLLLATLCRTRGQLNALSVVVVLSMSALGGSMVPRYVMSQPLRDAGLWTFNAWALDGYDKVFWRELPVAELWPQMSVLMLSAAVFLVSARAFAVRWESQ